MPVKVNKEMEALILSVITDNQGIYKAEMVKKAELKEWYVSATSAELVRQGKVFKAFVDGRATYYTTEYAIRNKIPARKVSPKKDWTPPENKDPSLLGDQLMFNQLYSGLSH